MHRSPQELERSLLLADATLGIVNATRERVVASDGEIGKVRAVMGASGGGKDGLCRVSKIK